VAVDLEWRENLRTGLERLGSGGIDVILLDLSLPDSPKSFKTFSAVQARAPAVPIVILTSLADETFAVNAVRRGAQDYLVKRYVDGELLVRTLRCALARGLGEERALTPAELEAFDGKAERPAYVAFKGRIYDVTRSRLWKAGNHVNAHAAGRDLTEGMRGAPHGEEVLMSFHAVGRLSRESTEKNGIVERLSKMHLHPISVHFSSAYSLAVPLLSALYLVFGASALSSVADAMLALGALAAPFSTLTGLWSWKVNYAGKMNRLFLMKLVYTFLFLAITLLCCAWRLADPHVLAAPGLRYVYLACVVSLVPCVTVLGHYGGKIVYS